MTALLEAALAPVNLFWTILLGIVVLYWFSVILGALDLDAFDLDLDVDADVDVDADLDADVDAEGSGGYLLGVLSFFNFGRVPTMIVFSVVVVAGWMASVELNGRFGSNEWGFALATFLPILIGALFVGKLVTLPLVPLFDRINRAAEAVDYIGREARLRLPAGPDKFGQAEVNIDGDELLVSVKTRDTNILAAGEPVVITGKTADGRYYLVERQVPLERG